MEPTSDPVQLMDRVCVSALLQIQDIVRMSHLLTIFRVSEGSGDVDVAILQALFKGGVCSSPQTPQQTLWLLDGTLS